MNPSLLTVTAMTVGLIVNTLAMIVLAWRGGHVLGRVDATMSSLTQEVQRLRESQADHAKLIADQSLVLERIVANLKALDDRMTRELKRR